MSMLQLERDVQKLAGSAKLSDAVEDVDKLIDLLLAAKERIATANEPHTTSIALTKLQNPIREGLEALNTDLKKVHKAQNDFNKSLKGAFAKVKGDLPTDHDPMESHQHLINRAIAMHLLREGQFNVASTFIHEVQPEQDEVSPPTTLHHASYDENASAGDAMITDADIPADLTALQSQALQSQFSDMYSILSSLKDHDLLPAIEWARANNAELEARGSNLEFELCKLQFIWLFKGASVNGLSEGPNNGVSGALAYARENFGHFQQRHMKEIQKLSGAIVYSPNLTSSPYRSIFDISLAFEEVAASFTREFCSLLGLSAESPLYVAATAGSLALPQLVKYTSIGKAKGTEWTTTNELAFETPLPKSMVYHSIFVCPVSKEQSTDVNPPMILTCGHVLAKESLFKIAKGNRTFKCPYCPGECSIKDAREIVL
ncbi:putative regulator of gluconeogenesis Rmd5 [Microdochium bolleyi]|uniref:GID complex catalytic subunit 2 n=1 Tax=Microdochium bolleyi TaxID=196109 RepID=A0A136J2C3_9PEZI|nr:putative regulator of gluconeogenesis Rmd5 [Microdochium bolleyi]